MKKIWIFIILGIFVLLVISFITGYNSLVDAEEDIEWNKSQVINRLNERQDKINQLLPTVIGLQDHAEEIYNKITEARSSYNNARTNNDIEGMIEADAQEALAINQLLVIVEDNPNIHATEAFINLMDNISGIESALSQARRDYNDSVSHYNRSVRKFPKMLYASLYGFEKQKPYWRMNDGADEIPEIKFSNK